MIARAMDLGTVKRRIAQGGYPSPEHAWADVLLVRSIRIPALAGVRAEHQIADSCMHAASVLCRQVHAKT